MTSERLKQDIEGILGISLAAEEIPEERLRKMRKLADILPHRVTEVVEIPLDPPKERIPDPRLSNHTYRRSFYSREQQGRRRPEIIIPKLEVVLDLDHTLVECIMPQHAFQKATVEDSKKQIEKEMQSVEVKMLTTMMDAESVYMLFTKRPGADTLLRKLKKFANLTLFTKGQEVYVKDILTELHWTELFDKIICVTEDRKSLQTKFPDLDRKRVIIVDDQLKTWVDEDQQYIVPVTRYMPLFKYDKNCSENRRHAERFLTFSFHKDLPDYKEATDVEARTSFLDGYNSAQLVSLCALLREIHEHMFVYQQSAADSFRFNLTHRLREKRFSLAFPPQTEDKESNIKKLIELMGGRVTKPGSDVTALSLNPREANNVGEIFKTYFKPQRDNQPRK